MTTSDIEHQLVALARQADIVVDRRAREVADSITVHHPDSQPRLAAIVSIIALAIVALLIATTVSLTENQEVVQLDVAGADSDPTGSNDSTPQWAADLTIGLATLEPNVLALVDAVSGHSSSLQLVEEGAIAADVQQAGRWIVYRPTTNGSEWVATNTTTSVSLGPAEIATASPDHTDAVWLIDGQTAMLYDISSGEPRQVLSLPQGSEIVGVTPSDVIVTDPADEWQLVAAPSSQLSSNNDTFLAASESHVATCNQPCTTMTLTGLADGASRSVVLADGRTAGRGDVQFSPAGRFLAAALRSATGVDHAVLLVDLQALFSQGGPGTVRTTLTDSAPALRWVGDNLYVIRDDTAPNSGILVERHTPTDDLRPAQLAVDPDVVVATPGFDTPAFVFRGR